MNYKKILLIMAIVWISGKASAQDPITLIIKEGITKVIVAVDLKIQRLQNETIWLQNAQKTLENTMSKLKLEEISGWVEKQRALYDEYFQELWKVKSAFTYYQRVRDIFDRQVQMVNEYKEAWRLFRQDEQFTQSELDYMLVVYTGMFEESLQSLEQLSLVINAFATQMSDAKRMEIINDVSDNLEQSFMDLKQFNHQNKMISLQRATEKGEIETVKKLYGL